MAKTYNFFGIKVLDAENYMQTSEGKRLKLSDYPQFDRAHNRVSMCDQAFRDRLAKANALMVCKSHTDVERRRFVFDVQNGTNPVAARVEISFDIAAKQNGWKRLDVKNGMVIYKSK